MTADLTPEQITWLEVAEAAGRLAWFILVLKEAKGEQYRRPRNYRLNPKDFMGNAYMEYLTRLANRNNDAEVTI